MVGGRLLWGGVQGEGWWRRRWDGVRVLAYDVDLRDEVGVLAVRIGRGIALVTDGDLEVDGFLCVVRARGCVDLSRRVLAYVSSSNRCLTHLFDVHLG